MLQDPAAARKEHYVAVPGGGVALHFIPPPQSAKPDAPTLVFLHEGLGCIGMWKDFPAALALATGCAGLVYDRPGHGRLGLPAAPRGADYFETEAYDVLPAVLDAAGSIAGRPMDPQNLILVGHSDGGTIALLYASRFPVRGVITEAAHVLVEDISIEGVRAAVRSWRETDFPSRLARYHGDNTEAVFAAWSKMWQSDWFRGWSIEATLPNVECPVLALQGEDDEYGTLAQLDAIETGVGGAVETSRIAHCGHSPHLQARDVVLATMAQFVAAVRRIDRVSEATDTQS
ncbi:MAG: pimeloyl-ACP methyl ester carboxylesterase [Alphaproteobacteria bacterium]